MPDADRGPYARFYYERFRREYPAIYGDPLAFGWWMKLLTEAEIAYPQDPLIPRGCADEILAALAELVEILSGDRYRIKGMAAERGRRSDHAKRAADARWNAPRIAPALPEQSSTPAQPMPRTRTRDKDEREKERGTVPRAVERSAQPLSTNFTVERVLSELVTDRSASMGASTIAQLRSDVEAVGEADYCAALRATKERANGGRLDLAGLIFSTHKALFPIPDGPSKGERSEGESRAAFDKRVRATRSANAPIREALGYRDG